jgi:hypothetical protein
MEANVKLFSFASVVDDGPISRASGSSQTPIPPVAQLPGNEDVAVFDSLRDLCGYIAREISSEDRGRTQRALVGFGYRGIIVINNSR